MTLRIPSVLATRFNETLRAVGGFDCPYGHTPQCHLSHDQVEDLVDRLKYDLARALLASPTVVVVATLDLDPLERALIEAHENSSRPRAISLDILPSIS